MTQSRQWKWHRQWQLRETVRLVMSQQEISDTDCMSMGPICVRCPAVTARKIAEAKRIMI